MISNFSKFIKEDIMDGGLSAGKSIKDIAKKHGISIDKIEKEVKKGEKVQREHTKTKNNPKGNPQINKKIALDHITEFEDYYDGLEDMEKELKKRKS